MHNYLRHVTSGDVVFGVAGTSFSFIVGTYSQLLGAISITLTVVILALRLKKEWKGRND